MQGLSQGEIYVVTNKINGKHYVGQAAKYVSKDNVKWGTEGRWKSHVREALSGSADHCLLLNQAIRKYGVKSFDVRVLCECHMEQLDAMEDKYIMEYGSLAPNGYNLKLSTQDSQDTRERKSSSRVGKTHSEATKKKISQGQLGNRRGAKQRKYEDDNHLPKYIGSVRKDGIIIGYKVVGYPIGVNTKQYYNKEFKDKDNTDACLQKALAHLKELDDVYSKNRQQQQEWKQQLQKDDALSKSTNKALASVSRQCEDHGRGGKQVIHPIVCGSKIAGYAVDGLIDFEGKPIPRKEFCGNINRWNFDKAIRFVEQVDIINKLQKCVDNWDNVDCITRRTKQGVNEEFLPKFINKVNSKGEHVGYCVNGVPYTEGGEKKKYYKKFTKSSMSMTERYEAAIQHLNDLKKDPKYKI